jgi:hypothetical protein
MTKLNMSDNRIVGKTGGKVLSDMIAQNSVLQELDASSNCKYARDDGAGFAKVLAVAISDNRALSSLNLASNWLCGVDEWGGGGTFDTSGIMLLVLFLITT